MMVNHEVLVVRTGTANLASVLASLRRAGAQPRISDDPKEVHAASRLVLPGVGAFAAAIDHLQAKDLVTVLAHRVRAGKPTLAICLGLQLLAEGSAESPGVKGFGVVPGQALRFPNTVRVPQLGWNRIEVDADCRFLRRGYAYFANSYRLVDPPPGWHTASADHGGSFVAAMERGGVLACQFHPELSGKWGLGLLHRWLIG